MAVFICVYSVTCKTTKWWDHYMVDLFICGFDTLQLFFPVIKNVLIQLNVPPLWLSTIRLKQGCKLFQHNLWHFVGIPLQWVTDAKNTSPSSCIWYWLTVLPVSYSIINGSSQTINLAKRWSLDRQDEVSSAVLEWRNGEKTASTSLSRLSGITVL